MWQSIIRKDRNGSSLCWDIHELPFVRDRIISASKFLRFNFSQDLNLNYNYFLIQSNYYY